TLPMERGPQGSMIRFPFGIGDLSAVAGHPFSRLQVIEDTEFWLGVGADDNNPGDLPRAWDQYLGTTRVQRARVFQDAWHALGVKPVLVASRGERHSLSPDMTATACSFLRALDLASAAPNQTSGSPVPIQPARTRGHF